ncbi:MAG: ABC transporter permease [Acidobacteriota bacterium]|nr:ABC transporter permease [Acidobacteriota bacterium]
MIEMVRRFLRQKYGSAGVVVALALLALLEILHLASGGAERGFQLANWAIFVLAAGSVSRDISSGALQMILSRPIRRTEYLFGRYLGILAGYAAFLVVTSAFAVLAVTANPSGAARLSFWGLAVAAAGAFLSGAFQAAILLFFSTFLPGIADLLGLLMLYLVLNLPPWKPWLREATRIGRENLIPTVPWNEVLRGQGLLGAATGRWVFALSVYLTLAAVVFCRRELPYGQD